MKPGWAWDEAPCDLEAAVIRMRTIQKTSAPIHRLMRIPVPWVFILAYLVGVGLQFLFPLTVHAAEIHRLSRVAGLVFLVVGAALAGWCLLIFRKIKTTTVPFESASHLVTWGPYKVSRNPMYISLILAYLGEAAILEQVWPLPLLALTVLYLARIVIPFEENRLQQVFGATYGEYCARVRRWI